MSLKEFQDAMKQVGDGAFSDEALSALSGLSRADAHELGLEWRSWDVDKAVQTLRSLRDMSDSAPFPEFDTLFKVLATSRFSEVRFECVEALSASTDLELVTLFIDLVRNDDAPEVRAAAAGALGGFVEMPGGQRLPNSYRSSVMAALIDAVTEDVDPIRGKALISLAAMPGFDASEHIAKVLRSIEGNDSALVDVLAAMGKTGDRQWISAIVDALGNFDAEVRSAAVKALGEIAEDDDVQLLSDPLDDHVLAVQLCTIDALKAIGTPAAREMLRSAEDSSEPDVQAAAKSSLSALKDEDELIFAVSPAMIDRGLYGAPLAAQGQDRDLSRYDAPTQEGWANVNSQGVEVDEVEYADDIGEDMEDYLESDEFFRSSNN